MTIDEPVVVGMVNNSPKYVIWKGRSHTITKIGLHHAVREGRTLYHIFSVIADTVFLRLQLNTDNLLWRITDVESRL